MTANIVIIGGGPAGVVAAIEAKKQDAGANVILVTAESSEPYEKPPLSKAVLLAKATPEEMPIAGPGGLEAQGVSVVFGARCETIDREGRKAVTTAGVFAYDAMVLATGSRVRELPFLPPGMPGVHYLRTDADARALRDALAASKDLVVVGAGLIGLEVAASAAERSLKVTVVEAAPRVMMRACDAETGARILDEHRRRGVDVRLSTAIRTVERRPDGRLALETDTGEILVADNVVVGAGVRPDDALAAAVGLAVNDGIVVDAQCRTSDPAILAAGDCTRFPGPEGLERLENWKHAMDQGEVAGRNAAGAGEVYQALPSYWSEQYDLYIQGVGWPAPDAARVRRPLDGESSLVLEVRDGKVNHALGINASRDLSVVRRLIERGTEVELSALVDPAQPLNALLKPKA